MLYFELKSKITGETISSNLVDKLLCEKVYQTVPHDIYYGGQPLVFNWFDSIGYMLASGMKLEDGNNSVREYYRNNELWAKELPIIEKTINFLQENYTCKSGYCR